MISRLLRIAMPKARLANTALKLSNPTQLVGWPKPFQLKTEYQAASPTGTTTNSENSKSAGGRNKRTAVHLPTSNEPPEARLVAEARRARKAAGRRPRVIWKDIEVRTSIALRVGILDRLGGRLRRHGPAGDLRGGVIDDAADIRTQILVIEILVILRRGQVLRDVAHEGTPERRVCAQIGR